MNARRWLALGLALILALALASCGDKTVQQGMVTKDGLTFLAATVTDEKAGTVAVTVTMTNGTGGAIYLCAPELTCADGATALYLDMAITGGTSESAALAETGLTRWLCVDPRESYAETCVFTGTLPATLTVTVQTAAHYSGEFAATVVELDLK